MSNPLSSLATPDTSHLKKADFEHVYEPVEDSFLLLDAFEADQQEILDLKPSICVEVGSGSGIAITCLAQLVGSDARYFATDINPLAVKATQQTAEKNNVVVTAVKSDLVEEILSEVAGKVDVLLFNPPYVVTPSEEVESTGIEASWAGGKNGREVLNRLLPLIPSLLTPGKGRFYLVVIDENVSPKDEDDLRTILPEFSCRVVNNRRSGPENLSVLCYAPSTPSQT
eukprot:m.69684 g.69684  ORF g.69684 m.69684 type:complete len:227 (+) comp24128_c1_seq2:435-1115(+)